MPQLIVHGIRLVLYFVAYFYLIYMISNKRFARDKNEIAFYIGMLLLAFGEWVWNYVYY